MATVKYDYSMFRLPVPAESVALALEEIRAKHGKLTPELLLQEATDRGHMLHDYFEWDNKTAAAKYRIEQAANIIRSIVTIIEEDEPVRVRAFMKVEEAREYKPFHEVMANKPDMEYVIRQAKIELEQFKRKYTALKVLPEYNQLFIEILSETA
jgi:hypothetical protein